MLKAYGIPTVDTRVANSAEEAAELAAQMLADTSAVVLKILSPDITHKSDVGGVALDLERMPGARWFPQARLNFAENLLRRRDAAPALIFRGEDRVQRTLGYDELRLRRSDFDADLQFDRGRKGIVFIQRRHRGGVYSARPHQPPTSFELRVLSFEFPPALPFSGMRVGNLKFEYRNLK